jgi:HK97 family phage major capsid protein
MRDRRHADRLRRLPRGYLIVDRTGVRVLRDPYSAKPYVLFYTTKRVGGGVQDFDAIKLVKFGTA